MKCGYKGCNCKMKQDISTLNFPKKFECPKCHTTAILKSTGQCIRYDLDGKIYTCEENDKNTDTN